MACRCLLVATAYGQRRSRHHVTRPSRYGEPLTILSADNDLVWWKQRTATADHGGPGSRVTAVRKRAGLVVTLAALLVVTAWSFAWADLALLGVFGAGIGVGVWATRAWNGAPQA